MDEEQEEEDQFEYEEEPDYYICMCCGNVQSTGFTCNKCYGPTSEGWY